MGVEGEIKSFLYKEHRINYKLTRKNVKNINLRIKPTGEIFVSAHRKVPFSSVDAFVISRGEQIIRYLNHLTEINERLPLAKQYVCGESFNILGGTIRLEVLQGGEEGVECDSANLFLTVKDENDFKRKEKLVNRWLEETCREVYTKIAEDVYVLFRKYNVSMPQIRIRNMKTRWGTCHPKKGVITLNKKLIETTESCIEYVMVHEFCHFIHPNHSKEFYLFLALFIPNWKERKRILKQRDIYGY